MEWASVSTHRLIHLPCVLASWGSGDVRLALPLTRLLEGSGDVRLARLLGEEDSIFV